ncbi:hypothetical protein B0I27_10374 [Arcticibacter pallidicorallinus]|uniref:Uncharacterized protein n=1 Tax=Arcticibacter pallidicorallinus TaxID=1259464 RepID=A0A2T0U6Q8_9SPHI|nr:hypothetical protein [Arcticibacter pallidicorallinus]PRY53605.1 hypothetical protein B0I27_10374 [Arcticibacter pallidicorallinus]
MKFKLTGLLCLSFILQIAGCATGSKRDIELQDSLETVRIADSLLNLELSLDDSVEFEIDTISAPKRK